MKGNEKSHILLTPLQLSIDEQGFEERLYVLSLDQSWSDAVPVEHPSAKHIVYKKCYFMHEHCGAKPFCALKSMRLLTFLNKLLLKVNYKVFLQ